MSTKRSTIDYYLDQLAGLRDVVERKMFGEYAVYCFGKVVALVCDDQFFLKITESGKKLIGKRYREGFPYPGAKPWILVDEADIEDRERFCELVRVTTKALPEPRLKQTKKKMSRRRAA